MPLATWNYLKLPSLTLKQITMYMRFLVMLTSLFGKSSKFREKCTSYIITTIIHGSIKADICVKIFILTVFSLFFFTNIT